MLLVVSAALALGIARGRAQATNDAVTSVAELAWLAGQWRGTTPAGRTIETTYTTPEGGVLLGTSKEYTSDGHCVFFDLEHFAMKDGVLTLTPHPAGKRSRDSFPLATYDRAARRATFVNRAHDWPQQFVYERVSDERLLITLSGPDKKGGEHVEQFELQLFAGGRRSADAQPRPQTTAATERRPPTRDSNARGRTNATNPRA